MEVKIPRGTFAGYVEIEHAEIDDYLDSAEFATFTLVKGKSFSAWGADKKDSKHPLSTKADTEILKRHRAGE